MIKVIKKWLANRKKKQAMAKGDLIRQQFQVCESNGCIWITCNGVAVKSIQSSESAESITNSIEAMRNIAVQYEMKWY